MEPRDAILEYLSNPSYQNNLMTNGHTKNLQNIETITNADRKFYRKRIINLFKDAFKENAYPEDIKKIHEAFMNSSIKYFKLIDTRDILQEDHDLDISSATKQTTTNASNVKQHIKTQELLSQANHVIMREKGSGGNLDAFVERKTIHVAPPMKMPSKKPINLSAPALKKKGLKEKNKKKGLKKKTN